MPRCAKWIPIKRKLAPALRRAKEGPAGAKGVTIGRWNMSMSKPRKRRADADRDEPASPRGRSRRRVEGGEGGGGGGGGEGGGKDRLNSESDKWAAAVDLLVLLEENFVSRAGERARRAVDPMSDGRSRDTALFDDVREALRAYDLFTPIAKPQCTPSPVSRAASLHRCDVSVAHSEAARRWVLRDEGHIELLAPCAEEGADLGGATFRTELSREDEEDISAEVKEEVQALVHDFKEVAAGPSEGTEDCDRWFVRRLLTDLGFGAAPRNAREVKSMAQCVLFQRLMLRKKAQLALSNAEVLRKRIWESGCEIGHRTGDPIGESFFNALADAIDGTKRELRELIQLDMHAGPMSSAGAVPSDIILAVPSPSKKTAAAMVVLREALSAHMDSGLAMLREKSRGVAGAEEALDRAAAKKAAFIDAHCDLWHAAFGHRMTRLPQPVSCAKYASRLLEGARVVRRGGVEFGQALDDVAEALEDKMGEDSPLHEGVNMWVVKAWRCARWQALCTLRVQRVELASRFRGSAGEGEVEATFRGVGPDGIEPNVEAHPLEDVMRE